jgi:hypothetical protein
MDDFDQFERSLAAALRSDADQSIARFEPATVARAAMAGTQRRSLRLPWNTVRPTSNRWAIAAAAVIAVLLVGGAIFLIQRGQPSIGGPGPTPSADPSQHAVVAPSAGPTASPSPTPTPILWTQASLHEDWPAPVRAEPAGGAIVQPILHDVSVIDGGSSFESGRHRDPSGDTGSDAYPWIDIQELDFCQPTCLRISVATNVAPEVEPSEQWIAYGIVWDDDRDGIADRRFGVDNKPVTATSEFTHRAWLTDLNTGRTESLERGYGGLGEFFVEAMFPPGRGGDGAWLDFGGEVAGGGTVGGLPNSPFYAWTSVIVDGRVVATDYAPDVGWLEPVPEVDGLPDSTPPVKSSPGPSPQVENDPDVPGGRLWTVRAVNDSSAPATLFVAEEDESGMARLVGSVTPNVVPPGATENVTFHLPAQGVTGWWIFVNPGPDTGPLLAWTDVPLAGEIRITADGQVAWLSL